jgi:hypothetical protein
MQTHQTDTYTERPDPIKEELRSLGQPVELFSLDGKEDIAPKDIKMGGIFFENYKKTSNRDLLDKACEKGCFHALALRITHNKLVITSGNHSPEEIKAATQTLLNDLNRLANLYWSVGHIHACRIFLQLGDHFHKNNDAQKAATYWEESARMFYMAKLLMRLDVSENLRIVVYKGKDYTASGFPSIEAAETTTTNHLAQGMRETLFSHAQNRVKDMVDHHPHGVKYISLE